MCRYNPNEISSGNQRREKRKSVWKTHTGKNMLFVTKKSNNLYASLLFLHVNALRTKIYCLCGESQGEKMRKKKVSR